MSNPHGFTVNTKNSNLPRWVKSIISEGPDHSILASARDIKSGNQLPLIATISSSDSNGFDTYHNYIVFFLEELLNNEMTKFFLMMNVMTRETLPVYCNDGLLYFKNPHSYSSDYEPIYDSDDVHIGESNFNNLPFCPVYVVNKSDEPISVNVSTLDEEKTKRLDDGMYGTLDVFSVVYQTPIPVTLTLRGSIVTIANALNSAENCVLNTGKNAVSGLSEGTTKGSLAMRTTVISSNYSSVCFYESSLADSTVMVNVQYENVRNCIDNLRDFCRITNFCDNTYNSNYKSLVQYWSCKYSSVLSTISNLIIASSNPNHNMNRTRKLTAVLRDNDCAIAQIEYIRTVHGYSLYEVGEFFNRPSASLMHTV